MTRQLETARRSLRRFGQTIIDARKERSVSLRDLQAEVDIPASHLSRIERGIMMPSETQLQRINDWLLQRST